jgi:uncharacterized membrane protein YkvA (DUF1232 family)
MLSGIDTILFSSDRVREGACRAHDGKIVSDSLWKKTMVGIWSRVKLLRNDALALYFALRDYRTPTYAKAYIVLIFAYVLSPIDFVPEFLAGIGFIDDLVMLPLGVSVAQRLLPPYILADARLRADRAFRRGADIVRWGALILIAVGVAWLVLNASQMVPAAG